MAVAAEAAEAAEAEEVVVASAVTVVTAVAVAVAVAKVEAELVAAVVLMRPRPGLRRSGSATEQGSDLPRPGSLTEVPPGLP